MASLQLMLNDFPAFVDAEFQEFAEKARRLKGKKEPSPYYFKPEWCSEEEWDLIGSYYEKSKSTQRGGG